MRAIFGWIKKKKGASVIIVLTLAIVIILIVIAVMPLSVSERRTAERWADSVRAFYAAESGINRALAALNNGDWTGWDTTNPNLYTLASQSLVDSGGTTISRYQVQINMTDPDSPIADAVGYSRYSTTTNEAARSIRNTFNRSEAAISAKGSVEIRGNAQVNGDINSFGDFSFQGIFGDTVANVKADADTQVVTDPANNYSPVPAPAEAYTDSNGDGQYTDGEPFTDSDSDGVWDGAKEITWFELVDNADAKITSGGWTGGGILVVEGGDFEITGGDFDGVIYVMGNLKIAGNPTIDGALFVDGAVEDILEISGTPVINYDLSDIIDAVGSNPMPLEKGSWREF